MEANRSPSPWTYSEFARLPSEEGARHEVIAGDVFMTPSPGATISLRTSSSWATIVHTW